MNFAPVSRTADDILRLKPSPYLGVDFEWDVRNNVPTILGVSDGKIGRASWWGMVLFTVVGR